MDIGLPKKNIIISNAIKTKKESTNTEATTATGNKIFGRLTLSISPWYSKKVLLPVRIHALKKLKATSPENKKMANVLGSWPNKFENTRVSIISATVGFKRLQ